MALQHTVKGPVGYTVVGNPTIVDGIASGFSSSDYLSLPAIPNNNIEMVFNFKTPSSSSSVQQAIFFSYYNSNSETLGIRIMETGKIMLNVGVYGSVTYDTALALDTDYWMKCIITNTTATALISTDGVNYTTFGTINNLAITDTQFENVRIGNWAGIRTFQGSIDLKQTYIKVNGQPWFGLCPVEVQKHQLKGPVGYSVVGIPTIVDGIASGFSGYPDSAAIIKTSQQLDTSLPFEINVEFKRNSTAAGCVVATNGGELCQPQSDNIIRIKLRNYANTADIYASYDTTLINWENNATYIFNLVYSNNSYLYTVKRKSDNALVYTKTISSEEKMSLGTFYFGGIGNSAYTHFDGSIDLNETYIKVNGKLWFWQPRETERIVVNGVEVWTKPAQQPLIDDNTLGVWHFENNSDNAVSGSSVGVDSSSISLAYVNSDAKFGDYCSTAYSGSTSKSVFTSFSSSVSNDFTIDFWVKTKSDSNNYYADWSLSTSRYSMLTAYVKMNIISFQAGSTIEKTVEANTWHHIALERQGTTLRGYLDGEMIKETDENGYRVTIFALYQDSRGLATFDELRLSNIARYQGQNFTPPTEEY